MYACMLCMYCNVTTFWQEIRARYATRFFHPLFTIDPNTTFIIYINIYIMIRRYTGIVVAKRTDQLITRGKLNLNMCHNVRGRKGFTLPSRDIFFGRDKNQNLNLNSKNILPSVIVRYDFVKILIRSMVNFIYLYIFRILVRNVTISIFRQKPK